MEVTKANRAGPTRAEEGQNPAPLGKKIDMANPEGDCFVLERLHLLSQTRSQFVPAEKRFDANMAGRRVSSKKPVDEKTSLDRHIL